MFTCRQTRSAKILSNDLDICWEDGEIEFYIPKDDHQIIFSTLTYPGWWRWAIFNCFGVQCRYVIFSNLIMVVFILYLISYPNLQSRIHCPFAYPLKLVSGFLTCVCDMAAQKHHGGIALLVKESSPLLMDVKRMFHQLYGYGVIIRRYYIGYSWGWIVSLKDQTTPPYLAIRSACRQVNFAQRLYWT